MTTNNKQAIGRQFEKVISKKYNLELVPQSGAGPWRKLDLEGKQMLVSCKATKNKSFSVKEKDLREAYDAVKGPGGSGGEVIPLLLHGLVKENEPQPSDPAYVTLSIDDFLYLLENKVQLFEPTKEDIRIQESSIPSLLRD